MGIQCWNFPEVSCSEISTMRTSVLLAAGILAIVGLFDLTNSTFTGTGALTLTIPALTTTGTALTATQAAALGLGAVGLLGAAALGVAASSRGSSGGSSGRPKKQRSRGSHRRSGRAVGDEQHEATDFVFKAIFEMDVNDCAKQYLCEISATSVENLSTQDTSTLLLFQTTSTSSGSFRRSFDEAALLGATTGNQLTCQQRYTKCGIKGSGLANILNSLNIVQSNDL